MYRAQLLTNSINYAARCRVPMNGNLIKYKVMNDLSSRLKQLSTRVFVGRYFAVVLVVYIIGQVIISFSVV